MSERSRIGTILLLGGLTLGCNAARKTAPVAPSGVIAACSARELASALWPTDHDIKIKHGITIGSEIGGEGSATLGYGKEGSGSAELAGKLSGKLTREKASEVELELPEERRCYELGYLPQLGRWVFEVEAKFISDNDSDFRKEFGNTWQNTWNEAKSEIATLPCSISDSNNCLCRGQKKPRLPLCTAHQKKKQTRALMLAVLYGHESAERRKAATAAEKLKAKPLLECLTNCTCAEATATGAAETSGRSDAAVERREECCAARCRLEHGADNQSKPPAPAGDAGPESRQ